MVLGIGRVGRPRADGPERGGTIPRTLRASEGAPRRVSHCEGPCPVPDRPPPARVLVSRRAIAEVVRAATLGSYGVTGFASDPLTRLLGRIGLATPGLTIALGERSLEIDLDVTVAYGLPVAEVARQVDSAVRYRVGQALGRGVDKLTIRVDGLECPPGRVPAVRPAAAVGSSDLAESGTDVG